MAALITFAARFIEGPCGSPFWAPGWRTTPAAPIPSPIRSAWTSEASDFLRSSASLRRAVDQVDGVDHDRVDRGSVHRLTAGGEVLLVVSRRPPHPRALVEDLDRRRSRARRRARPPCRARRCGDVGADQHGASSQRIDRRRPDASPLRPLADRRPAHRRRADGTLQLARRAPCRRRAGAADRGHRPRALDRRERRADPRRAALAGARLGRGAGLQAARADRHAAALERLLESGAAYRDTATGEDVEAWKAEHGGRARLPRRAGEDAGAAVRLRVPDEGETVVEDLIRGPVSFPNRSYDDFVIARGDGCVLYNFAVAVDDAEMGITDVVRGDDHLSNTPKQLLVLDGARRTSRRATRTCPCCTAPTARSSPSATAPPRCRSCARRAICPPRSATTWRCSAGAPTTTRP